MNAILPFIIEHWASISAIVAAIGLRLFPTEKNYDVFSKILKLLDLIVPNIKKGGGRHAAKIILFFVLAFACENSFAQLNTRTRQIRFATGVQKAADTTANADNAGRIWYDFATGRYRANFDGVNDFFGESTVTASNGLTKNGSDIQLGGALTKNTSITGDFRTTFAGGATNAGLNVGYDTAAPSSPSAGDIWYRGDQNVFYARGTGSLKIMQGSGLLNGTVGAIPFATSSTTSVFSSTSNLGFDATNNYFLLNSAVNSGFGATTPTHLVNIKGSANDALFLVEEDAGGDAISIDEVDGVIHIKMPLLPTSASGLPSGTLWNNAGVLNVAP